MASPDQAGWFRLFLSLALLGSPFAYGDFLKAWSQDRQALLREGIQALRRDDLAAAVRVLDKLVRQRPHFAEGHYWLGLAHLERNQTARAEQALSRAVELQPRYPEAYNALGVLYDRQGQFRKFRNRLSAGDRPEPGARRGPLQSGSQLRDAGKIPGFA